MPGKLLTIPLDLIRENKVALRGVDRQNEDYQTLVQSIRKNGFMGSIEVREKTDTETGEVFYEIINGLHRYTAAKEVGLTEINVNVIDIDDKQVLFAQIAMNLAKIETRLCEYSAQLLRIMEADETLTEATLAEKLGKSVQWLKDRLGLNNIVDENLRALIDNGDIPMLSAYALAKLPPDEQLNYVQEAVSHPPSEFLPVVNARYKEIRQKKLKGGTAPDQYVHNPRMRKISEVRSMLEDSTNVNKLVGDYKLMDAMAGFQMGLRWVLTSDPNSVNTLKAEWDAKQAEQQGKRKERDEVQQAKAKESAELKVKLADMEMQVVTGKLDPDVLKQFKLELQLGRAESRIEGVKAKIADGKSEQADLDKLLASIAELKKELAETKTRLAAK